MNRILTYCFLVALVPGVASAQDPTRSPAEQLSLDDVVRMAIANNRSLQSAALQVEKAESELAAARTRRLPAFETEITASQLLTPVDFSFPRGAFGDFPSTGPIPAADTRISVPRQPTTYVSSQISQPISQLVRISLGIRSAAATRDLERERVRAQQLAIVASVKRLYFAILQTESALAAAEQAIAFYRELGRTLQVRVTQRVALRADVLDVQFRLAQEELFHTTLQNTRASQKEQMNQLLGRDVRTAFEVEDVSAISALEIDIEAAQRHALAARPDIQEARLKLQQAELDRRITNASRIPDVSLALSYRSNFNMDLLPRNLAAAGVTVTWEPFDWGRKGRELAVKSRSTHQARLAVREAEDRAVLEINSRFRTLTERRALLRVAQLAQDAAREKLRVKTNQYQIEAALLPDVLQLRAELASMDDRCQQALLAFWTARADFEQAAGEEVTR